MHALHLLKPFTLAQQQLQTVSAPIGHLISRIVRRTMRTTEQNWVGKGGSEKYTGAYQEWREGMQAEGKDVLVDLLDSIGTSIAECTLASLQKRLGHAYMQYYDALEIIDPTGPKLPEDGTEKAGRMWSAVEVLCEVNGLCFDDVKREVKAMRSATSVEMSGLDEKLCKKNVLAWYKKKHDQGNDLSSALSECAQLVFSVPFETVLIESLFSIMNYSKSGRRCSTGDTAVENAIHLRSAPAVLGKDDKDKPFGPGETTPDEIHLRNVRGADLGGAVDLRYDTSAALNADLTKLSSFTAADTAVQTMPTPPASKVPFKCYAEDWETTTDKRKRRGQGWRTRCKYVGMVFEDKEKDELRRVVGAKWQGGECGLGARDDAGGLAHRAGVVPCTVSAR